MKASLAASKFAEVNAGCGAGILHLQTTFQEQRKAWFPINELLGIVAEVAGQHSCGSGLRRVSWRRLQTVDAARSSDVII